MIQFLFRSSCLILGVLLGISLPLCGAASAGEGDAFAPAFSADAVDLAETAVFLTDDKQPALAPHRTPARLEYIQSLLGAPSRDWNFGWPGYKSYRGAPHPELKAPVAHYRLCFKEAVSIGATQFAWRSDGHYDGQAKFFYLKPDAAYPGDPLKAGDWQELVSPQGQTGLFRTLPAGLKVRAVLVRHEMKSRSGIERWWFFQRRLFDLRHGAVGQGERAPGAADGMNLTRGTPWVNTWPRDENSPVLRRTVSDVEPSWVILSWEKPYPVCGVYVAGNVLAAQPFILRESYAGNPVLQPAKAWKAASKPVKGSWFPFPAAETRAVKLNLNEVSSESHRIPGKNQVAQVTDLRVFTDLGEAPEPELAVIASGEPPFTLEYTLDRAGEFCLAVDDATGVRSRNLVAQIPQEAGTHKLHWDLKDTDGVYVAPGNYRWKAVVGPSPELRYEMTVYPNIAMNSPMNAPWLNGHSGSGGWLADHSGNSCISVSGESVFIGAYCAESGVALIETDLDGNKKWGRHNLVAWTGPQMLANDGTDLYAAIHQGDADTIWRIDRERKTNDYLTIKSTPLRHNGLRSMAIRDGRLYLSMISPRREWIVNAVTASEVDMLNVVPLPPKEAKGGKPDFLPDPRLDFLRLLRLTGSPAGLGHKDSPIYLTSERGPERKQHIVIPFTSALPLGSLVYSYPPDANYSLRFSVLKADAPYPPDRSKESQWIPVGTPGPHIWDILPLPENTVTRALRITFLQGGEDDLMDALDALDGEEKENTGLALNAESEVDSGPVWAGQLEGLKILRRRFSVPRDGMVIRVNSGKVDPQGWWDAEREKILSPQDPGIYVMEWKTAQEVRGLGIREIDGEETRIDVYTGPDDKDIPLDGEAGWEEVAVYHQALRDFYNPNPIGNTLARYLDGYVDFGNVHTTRAIRLRVVKQWTVKEGRPTGIRADLGGRELDPRRCRIWGVVPVRYLGGEAPVDPLSTERVEVRDLKTTKLLQEVSVAVDAPLRFTPSGELLARGKNAIVKVDLAAASTTPLITDLKKSGTFTLDAEGRIYVFEGEETLRQVRVYDAAGKYLHSIGTAGGWRPGPWEPSRMGSVVDMAVDGRGQLWLVEKDKDPKRVTLWERDGTFKREYLGNTGYGGGGILDRYNKDRLFYGRMAFGMDWESGKSGLNSLNFLDTYDTGGHGIADLTPLQYQGRTYLVSGVSHPSMQGGVAFVFLQGESSARLVSAFGQAASFEPLQRPQFRPLLKGGVAQDFEFLYTDQNGDGEVQPDEVTLTSAPGLEHWQRLSFYGFDYDMAITTGRRTRFEVAKVLDNGTLVFEEKPFPALKGLTTAVEYVRKLRNGNYFLKTGGGQGQGFNGVMDPQGKVLWRYPRDHEGVCSLWIAPWKPGWVTHQFLMIGNETVPGDLGEVFLVNSNCGQWNVWTADGLLAGQVFRHKGDPEASTLSFPEHERGMEWKNMTMGQEHFSGSFTKTEADGKTYVVAGHNHISIAEVKGWEKFKRLSEEFTVTGEDIQAARQWELERAAKDLYVRAPKIEVNRGSLETVLGEPLAWIGDTDVRDRTGFSMAYDDTNLYVGYQVFSQGLLANNGSDWHLYFKSGAGVDLYLSTNEEADPARESAEAGDIRLLMTFVKDEPQVVLYAPKCPDAEENEKWEAFTPAGGRSTFDRVKLLPEVKLSRQDMVDRDVVLGYRVTAVIPLKSLGLVIKPGMSIKLDWGNLVSDTGNDVRVRRYWANTTNTGTADEAMESRLHPDLWGTAVFAGEKKHYADQLGGLGEAGAQEMDADATLDELDGL